MHDAVPQDGGEGCWGGRTSSWFQPCTRGGVFNWVHFQANKTFLHQKEATPRQVSGMGVGVGVEAGKFKTLAPLCHLTRACPNSAADYSVCLLLTHRSCTTHNRHEKSHGAYNRVYYHHPRGREESTALIQEAIWKYLPRGSETRKTIFG